MNPYTQYFYYIVHNLIAHPLLVICPEFGKWLHEYTSERMGEED